MQNFPSVAVQGLPKQAEANVDMEFNEIPYLKVAYDFLCAPIKKFVSSHIHDG